MEILGSGISSEYCSPRNMRTYRTIPYYKYYARRSVIIKKPTSYQELIKCINSVSEDVKSDFENDYKAHNKFRSKMALCVHPKSHQAVDNLRRSNTDIQNVRITLVYFARTDTYLSSGGIAINLHIYVDPLINKKTESDKNININDDEIDISYSSDYSGTYAKDVAKMSDDTIENALDGVPEAYSNID